MKEERIKILELLNQGKITADEAARLFDALNASKAAKANKQKNRSEFNFDGSDMEEKLQKFSKSVDAFSKEFGGKISGTFKELEPKFKKTAKTVMEKTAVVVEDLAKALNESVKNMEAKSKDACCDDDDCCCDDDDCCCEDESRKN